MYRLQICQIPSLRVIWSLCKFANIRKRKAFRILWHASVFIAVSFVSLQDARFNDEIDIKTGYKTRSILSMPVTDLDGQVVGVAMAINKLSVKDEPFDEHDEKVTSHARVLFHFL